MVDTKQLHWICSVPIGLTVSIIGLIGNFVSCLVWNRTVRSKLRGNQSTGIYLVALGIVDSGFLMFFILIDPIRMMNPDVDKSYFYASFFSWFGFPLYFMFFVASIWLVVGITFNRFIMIQFPTRVRGWYNKTRTFCGIFALITFSVTINIPHFWNFRPKKVNGTYSIAPTEYGSGDGSKNYEFWVHCIFVVLAPWAMIAILNGLIVYKLSTQMKKFIETDKPELRNLKTKYDRRERQMTRMLLVVTFAFLLFLAWQCVTQCFWMLGHGKEVDNDKTKTWNMVDASFAFAKLGVVFNSSMNCLFYCFTSSMFRKEMRNMFREFIGRYIFLRMSIRIESSTYHSSQTQKEIIMANSNA